jgi:GntR family transcriptional repressor for pyruvate dehydrogenase complex
MPDATTTGPQFGQFERDTLPERIAARLLALIAERQLRPGDKLPPERELAAIMHVSRASLREALARLAMFNIVEIRQGSGAYVTSLKPDLLVEHFDFVFALDDSTFSELLEARHMIEPGLAAVAAFKATEEDLVALRACLERSAAAVDDADAFLEVDLELHDLILAAARNQIITRFMAGLTRLGTASRRRTGALRVVREKSHREHIAIVTAILARDHLAAAAAMESHIRNIQTSLEATAGEETVLHRATSEPSSAALNEAAPTGGALTGGDYVTDHHVG